MQQVIAFVTVRGSPEQRGRRHGAVLAAEAPEGLRPAPSSASAIAAGRPGLHKALLYTYEYIYKWKSIYIFGLRLGRIGFRISLLLSISLSLFGWGVRHWKLMKCLIYILAALSWLNFGRSSFCTHKIYIFPRLPLLWLLSSLLEWPLNRFPEIQLLSKGYIFFHKTSLFNYWHTRLNYFSSIFKISKLLDDFLKKNRVDLMLKVTLFNVVLACYLFYVQTGWPWWTRSVSVGTWASWRGLPKSGEWCFVRLWLLLSPILSYFQRTTASLRKEARTKCKFTIVINAIPLNPHPRLFHLPNMNKWVFVLGVCTALNVKRALSMSCWLVWLKISFWCVDAERAYWNENLNGCDAHCEWGNVYRLEHVQ